MWIVHGRAEISFYIQERFREQCQKPTEGSASDFGLESRRTRRRRKPALKTSLREAMEAKRRAEDEAATLRKKLFAMEERQTKLQEGKGSVKGADGPVNSPEELAGEPSPPPGFPQVISGCNSGRHLMENTHPLSLLLPLILIQSIHVVVIPCRFKIPQAQMKFGSHIAISRNCTMLRPNARSLGHFLSTTDNSCTK